MHGRGTSRRTRLALAAIVVGALSIGAAHVVAAAPAELLPNLRPEIPTRLELRVVGNHTTNPRVELRFRSAIVNAGAGPLIIEGVRSRGRRAMRADQIIGIAGGGNLVRRGAGRLIYVRSRGHWNLARVVRSELRTVNRFRLVRRAHRIGACLRDGGNSLPSIVEPGEPASAIFTGRCGRRLPHLRHLHMGLSVGYLSAARPSVEGQNVDITTLPSGRYWLVQRVDPGRHLAQTTHADDTSSLLLRIRWRQTGARTRAVTVTPLRACPSSGRCRVGVPPGSTASVSRP